MENLLNEISAVGVKVVGYVNSDIQKAKAEFQALSSADKQGVEVLRNILNTLLSAE